MLRTSQPTFALLVPCYKAERHLPLLRRQVDQLTLPFDEILLADDSSPDGTAAMAEQMGFRVIRLKRNLGPGGARNTLGHAATADWVHFHDVDDELAPDYLTRAIAYADAETDVVFHQVDFIDEKTRAHLVRWALPDGQTDIPSLLLRNPMPTMSSLLRRRFFLDVGGFDEKHRCFEDGDLHFRLAVHGARIRLLPQVLEWSLRHANGAGSDQRYCYRCRLSYLEQYAQIVPNRLHATIANEAEKAAFVLSRSGDQGTAFLAIALAQRMGLRVPSTKSVAFKIVRSFLPPLTALRLREWFRRRLGGYLQQARLRSP